MATLPEEFWVDPAEAPKPVVEMEPPLDSIPEHMAVGFLLRERGLVSIAHETPRIARNIMTTANEIYVRCANGHSALMFSIKCRDGQCYGQCPVCGWKEKR